MGFDLATAKPVTGGFDLSTAKPVLSKPKANIQDLYNRARSGDAQALAEYNQRAQASGQNTLEQDQAANNPTTGNDNFVSGVGKSFMDTGRGVKQIFGGYTPEQIDEQRRIDVPLMDTKAGVTGNVAGAFAQFAVPVGGAAKGATLVGNAAKGAAFAGLQPVGSDETRGMNTAIGAAWGVAGKLAGNAIASAGSKIAKALTPAQIELWNAAKQIGVSLSPSQLTDSKWLKTLASQSKYWAGSGFNKQQTAQQLDFNRAIAKTLGEVSDKIDDPVMANVKSNQKALYDKAFDGVIVKVDQQAMAGYAALRKTLEKRLSADQVRQFEAVATSVGENLKGGKIVGKVYQELRKELKALESQNPNGFGSVVKDLRGIIEGTAKRSVPKANQEALAAADRLTRNVKVVEKARNRVANANGDIAPTSIWSPTHTKYGATPEMKKLSTLGQLIKDPIRDSGTATRLDTMGLYGLATAFPKAITGRAVNSPALSRYLVNQPKAIDGLSRAIGKWTPRVLPALTLGNKTLTEEEKKKLKKRP